MLVLLEVVRQLLGEVRPVLFPAVHAVADAVTVGVGAAGTGMLGANGEVLELDAAATAVGAAIMRSAVAIPPLTRLLAGA